MKMETERISMWALVARINRKLKPDLRVLKKAQAASAIVSVGEFYVLDCYRNWIVEQFVDPESYGRELGVLKDYEVLDPG